MKRNILIVEDDLAFGTMMQTWLGKKGFGVGRATSVGAAMRLLLAPPDGDTGTDGGFDLVLSDLRLPDRDGLELLPWMRPTGCRSRSS